LQPTLEEIETIARGAGEILRAGYGQSHRVTYKGSIDLVTETDHLSEDFILREIKQRWPDHRVITEESGRLEGNDCCQWFIDPLDGTVNFAHGVPVFCVSIAYAQNGVVKLGAVYEPLRDECFSAERGRGAWLNGFRLYSAAPIHPSQPPDLDHSLLVTGFSYDIRTNPRNNLDYYASFALRSQGVRRLGSAALDLCYVAAGRFDGYWELEVKSWDVAAGGLIAEEAGARITNVHGDPNYLTAPISILAASPSIYEAMRVILGE
jgi:myo-inositol-1(or 4)-monophosphatase